MKSHAKLMHSDAHKSARSLTDRGSTRTKLSGMRYDLDVASKQQRPGRYNIDSVHNSHHIIAATRIRIGERQTALLRPVCRDR